MKKLLLPLFAILILAALLTSCGSDPTEGAKAAADRFTRNLMAEDYSTAYRDASMNFRTQTRFDEFRFRAGKLRATPESSVSWSEPETKDGKVILNGTVSRAEGAPAKVSLTLAREIEEWKVSEFAVD